MVETSGDRGEVLKADRDMVRVLFENRSSFVLRQLPPFGRLDDGDEGGSGRFCPVEGRLHGGDAIVLGPRCVPLVASHSVKYPESVLRSRFSAEADLQVARRRQRWPAYTFESL